MMAMFADAIELTEGFGDISRGKKLRAMQQVLEDSENVENKIQLEKLAATPMDGFSSGQAEDRIEAPDPLIGRDLIVQNGLNHSSKVEIHNAVDGRRLSGFNGPSKVAIQTGLHGRSPNAQNSLHERNLNVQNSLEHSQPAIPFGQENVRPGNVDVWTFGAAKAAPPGPQDRYTKEL